MNPKKVITSSAEDANAHDGQENFRNGGHHQNYIIRLHIKKMIARA